MARLPSSVLFACSRNAVRSAMAEALLKHFHGRRIYVDSAGVRPGENDPFAAAVMAEMGLDLSKHRPKGFDDLEEGFFDLVITLAPEAQHRAVEMTRIMACDVEYWPTLDPTVVEGTRETRLDAYRQIRDQLQKRILERFPLEPQGAAE
jgi:protein-tyrosine-phosphatase